MRRRVSRLWISVMLVPMMACAASASEILSSNLIESVIWDPAYPDMPAELLSDLQELVRLGPAFTGERYHPLYSVLALNPASSRDQKAAGALYAKLGPKFAEKLTRGKGSPALLRSALRAHEQAAKAFEGPISLRVLKMGVRNGTSDEELWRQAEDLLPWSFYGANIHAHIAMARGIARGPRWELIPDAFPNTAYEQRLRQNLRKIGLSMSEAQDSDGPKVQAFMNRVRAKIGLPESRRNFNDIEARFDGKKGRFVILRDQEQKIAAIAAYHPARPGICELQMVYTAAPWQGDLRARLSKPEREFHIAKSLIKLMMEAAALHGYDTMELATRWDSQQPAFRVYSRLGFLPSAESLNPVTIRRRRAKSAYKPWGFADLMRSIRPAALLADFPDDFANVP